MVEIGTPPWSRIDILGTLDEFADVYANRPIQDNQGGMKSPHMFAVWFIARTLAPELIVESGIWKGQSTWLLETACPDAQLVSIDLQLKNREYISNTATYSDRDFTLQDWSNVPQRSLVFFDDHQNAYQRLQQCQWFGFQHIIFEDNYPDSTGDCYSLKKAFSHAGFDPTPFQPADQASDENSNKRTKSRFGLGKRPAAKNKKWHPRLEAVSPNDVDAKMLRQHLAVYYEFPPVIKTELTRWNDAWDDAKYPTPQPLLSQASQPSHDSFLEEAQDYTWICYAQLKSI